MNCYHCGATLTQYDFCTACKSDVKQYKLIMEAANRKYNEGLEKAQIRDLTGATAALKQSLKLNKEHVDARNLLGLIYFETGEVVSALGEWIISKNLQPEKNFAEDYISRLQNNQGKLDTFNQAIHKYNTALELCHQGSDDLAVIQLKKIVSIQPNFIKAHLLLALLYMESEEYDKAYPVLKRVVQIDHGNTQAQLYLREIAKINKQKGIKTRTRSKAKDDIVRYERDNEIIIQPAKVVEPNTSKGALAGFVIGVLLGAGVLFFLVMPTRLQSVRTEFEGAIRTANEQQEAQATTITSLEKQVQELTDQRDAVINQYGDLYSDENNTEAVNALISAIGAYLSDTENMEAVMPYMDICVQNETFFQNNTNSILGLYSSLKNLVSPALAQSHYDAGYQAYGEEAFEEAIEQLELAVAYYTGNADSYYYLGSAYQANGNVSKAEEMYQIIVEQFPGTTRAGQASRALTALQNQ